MSLYISVRLIKSKCMLLYMLVYFLLQLVDVVADHNQLFLLQYNNRNS